MTLKTVLRALAAMGVAMTLSACALVEDNIDITYRSATPAVAVAGADAVTVRVTAEDARPSNRDKVSVKKNGYGMEMAAIRANQDVPTVVRQAVETELESRGFRLGDGPVFVLIEVARFYADYKTGFWSADNVADIQLNVQVRDAGGQMYYGKGISGVGTVEGVMLMEGGPVKQSIEIGLAVAIANLLKDPFFLQALMDAQAANPPAPTPVASPVS
ncbi:MAG: YajG family lipoprotein [Caenispirillum bisanense]|nr:YajG family lipoprotein [Caenispirillum bisanense]MCA1972017.1 YajG family lipoprotein [Caenispirillum sp.]